MLVFHTDRSLGHDPDRYFRRGKIVAHPESAERYDVLLGAALKAGALSQAPEDKGLEPILRVHSQDYVDFLAQAWSRRAEIPGGVSDEILGTHFAKPQMHRRPVGLLGQMGYYTCDTSTPVRAGTWGAVYWSAQAAISSAEAALKGEPAYALCRPPGHHAFSDAAAGFCYFNNAAIAARHMGHLTGGKIAILDIDVHHGNGAQSIFYEDPNVLTISLHCDPSDYYPFFSGYEDETGSGPAEGLNRNFALPPGTGDEAFLSALTTAIEAIRTFNPAGLVVALGLDAGKDDPVGAFGITEDGFAQIATRIGDAGLPTTFIQEGGYLCDALPKNLTAFLSAFQSTQAD